MLPLTPQISPSTRTPGHPSGRAGSAAYAPVRIPRSTSISTCRVTISPIGRSIEVGDTLRRPGPSRGVSGEDHRERAPPVLQPHRRRDALPERVEERERILLVEAAGLEARHDLGDLPDAFWLIGAVEAEKAARGVPFGCEVDAGEEGGALRAEDLDRNVGGLEVPA